MGRHSLAKERRKPPAALAALIAPAAMFFAVTADVHPLAAEREIKPVAPKPAPAPEPPAPCCFEIVAAPPGLPSVVPPGASSAPAQLVSAASRYRVVDRALPAGVAPEKGLQVRTILTARHISAEFPEIQSIGGVRPDALRWHPNGLALDVMIPDPSSAAGIALGDQIVTYVLQNAKVFGIQDAIWRGVYYTPGGAKSGGYGHFDHVHVTTTGGGYPTGGETYYR
ncbi:hypothetical protein A5724_27650 [Mycobacterium sp. ACS1612]|uniref:hypothetical protein n=1 Tax=Mycobacterium sp. ACS1612 TaxID=1834117 RepID=UPI0007FF8FE7|nr:hypothetical protein [Mycobacterium sp. ACS1612]OBF28206.1 hypothetical protein A5724_27650 [Mycobacterium sp. ACS1612]